MINSNHYIVKNTSPVPTSSRYVSGFRVKNGIRVGVSFSADKAWVIPSQFLLSIVLEFARKNHEHLAIITVY